MLFLLFRHGFQTKPMHIGIASSRRVPTFGAISDHVQTKHSLLLPESKPNINENRNDSKMFGALRSPPPAANENRSNSTAQCGQCLIVPATA
jgi:hypothetical protein